MSCGTFRFNPLSVNPTKWSNTLKQFVGNLPTNCLRVLDSLVGSALKGLNSATYCIKISAKYIKQNS